MLRKTLEVTNSLYIQNILLVLLITQTISVPLGFITPMLGTSKIYLIQSLLDTVLPSITFLRENQSQTEVKAMSKSYSGYCNNGKETQYRIEVNSKFNMDRWRFITKELEGSVMDKY